MTLQPYDADRLDQLTLRLLDISHLMRKMADSLRGSDAGAFALHDRKALEWLQALETWAHRSNADLEMSLIKLRGASKARHAASGNLIERLAAEAELASDSVQKIA